MISKSLMRSVRRHCLMMASQGASVADIHWLSTQHAPKAIRCLYLRASIKYGLAQSFILDWKKNGQVFWLKSMEDALCFPKR